MNFYIDDKIYEVIVEKKKNKNLYIRVTSDLKIRVTCPYLYTKKMIESILNDNKTSIRKMLNNQVKRNINHVKEEDCLLGKPLNVVYKNVRKPEFINNILSIKDDNMKSKWFINMARIKFKEYLDEAYDVFDEDIPYPILKIRKMKTRWGVCNKKDNSVTLNLELIKKDPKFLNYVIVHELSHFIHFNHSKSFWNTVEKYCPEYKLVRKELKE